MKQKNLRMFIRLLFIVMFLMPFVFTKTAGDAHAQTIPDDKKEVFNSSGLPIPRFVSLAHKKTNVRAGPGSKYPVKWVIKKQNLPVEVILEYDHWRKIRDHEGAEGWVFHTLLSGKRTALVQSVNPVEAIEREGFLWMEETVPKMRLEPMSLVELEQCHKDLCYITVEGVSGWLQRKLLWGVYEKENFD